MSGAMKASGDAHAPLRHLTPAWFAIVMGLAGLALAWHRGSTMLGESATAVAAVLALLAAVVFAVLAPAALWRLQRHPEAWMEDLRHPMRHPFVAAMPISLLLLATLALALFGPGPLARAAWWAGSLIQLATTVWVLARWWRGNQAGGLQWAGMTPALFIPVVGNVLVPLAGVPLGHEDWAAAQFGIGLLFWPVVLVLIAVRVVVQGLWPERLRPSVFIVIAPPAVVGLGLLQFGAPALLAWGCWGLALFGLLWAATQARAISALPFALPHWAMSFPLAALAALSLRLATPGTAFGLLALALLALATLVVAALMLGTLRGLRNGTLLAPEPVAAIQPVAG
jgi:tellurite resistance protein